MFRLVVAVALVAVAIATRVFTIDKDLDNEWQEYIKYHNKQYLYGEELARLVEGKITNIYTCVVYSKYTRRHRTDKTRLSEVDLTARRQKRSFAPKM